MEIYLVGFDALGATSGATLNIIREVTPKEDEVFVWNDKFSFNGYEPTGVSSAMNTGTEQDAIADQGGSVAQTLYLKSNTASNIYDVTITYIDQNNA